VDPADLNKRLAGVLIEGETPQLAFKIIRDFFVFTEHCIILVDIQGMTGSKVDYPSISYWAVTRFAVETAGTFDLDSELKIWVSGTSADYQDLEEGDRCSRDPEGTGDGGLR
jgi:hypothetical protein